MSIPTLTEYPLPTAAELPSPALTWDFDPARAVLLIHDMQQYFLDFYTGGFGPLVDNVCRMKAAGLPTVYTAQPPKQDPASRGLLSDRWGAGLQDRHDIVAPLTPHEDDVVLTKHRYSAFHRSDLRQRMTDMSRDQLVITGVYAHIGITATALDAFSFDIKPFVVADAIGDFNRDRHLGALSQLAACCAVVTTVDGLLSATVAAPSLASVRAQVLAVLDEPAADDDDLLDAGLDSIRVMNLIEQWKAAGHEVGFADLAAEPTIRGFHAALAGSR
jgi:bifunctional isochorismate lyase/aryl carrier protein